MKRFFCLSLLSLLCATPALRAEDATAIAARQEANENYKILKGHVDELTESRDALLKRIQSLEKEIAELRTQVAKPAGNFATPDDLKRLADTVQEIDKKREADKKLILKELSNLGSSFAKGGSRVKDTLPPHVDETVTPPTSDPNQPTFTYTIKSGDTYSTIAQKYRQEGIKITSEQIEKANPNIKPTQLYLGKKIQIPDTRVAATDKPDAK